MKFKFAAGVALALMLAAPLTAAADEAFTPAQKAELGAFIKDYLVNNPDVLRAAIESLDKHEKEAAEDARKKVVDRRGGRAVRLAVPGGGRQPQGDRDAGRVF